MNQGPSSPPETARRFGVWMTAGAWIAVLAVASLVFGDWLAERENPNRRVDTDVGGGGVREVVLEQNRAGHYLATGEIDGTRVVFLLDTGATEVSVPLGVARRLGLRGRHAETGANRQRHRHDLCRGARSRRHRRYRPARCGGRT